MEKKNETNPFGAFLKKYIFNNLGLKILAVFFAMVVWGVVLTTQNLPRIKIIQNVNVSFSGSADLHARGFVVRGHPLEEKGGITVRARTPITLYKDLTEDYISATISLDSVTGAGMVSLPIKPAISAPYAAETSIESIDPEKFTIEIDTLISQSVPVEVRHEGTLPDGYWADEAQLIINSFMNPTITIRGPKQDVQRVTKAVCIIQLDGRTESYNDAVNLVLWDKNNEEVDATLFLDELPAATVKMAVYALKTVPVDAAASLLGADNLPLNYEIVSTSATPQELSIVGDEEVLAGINSLTFEGLDVSGRRESVAEKRALIVPEGVRVLGGTTEVDVFVDIREKMSIKEFKAVPIEQMELGAGLKAVFSVSTIDISVEGRVSLVDLLERNDVSAFVDLKGLREGVYENLDISVYLGDDETTLELDIYQSLAGVTVQITSG